MKRLNIGARVEIIGKCKSQFRQGVIINNEYWGTYSVRLDATSDKPACNIVINRKNVEKL